MMERRLTALLSIGFLSLALNLPLNAAADTPNASYTVEVSYPSDDDAPPEPIAGVEVSVYLVASLDEKNVYQPLTPFSDLDVSALSGMSAAEIQEMAYLLENRIAEQSIAPDMTAVTLTDGIAEFDDISAYGLYLTVQTASSGEAELYSEFDPFLIQIPNYDAEQGWIYDVKAEPKLRVSRPEETVTTTEQTTTTTSSARMTQTTTSAQTTSASSQTMISTDRDKPKTGDESKLQLWKIVFAVSVLGIVVLVADIIKDKRKKES